MKKQCTCGPSISPINHKAAHFSKCPKFKPTCSFGVPIQYILTIPIVKVELKDDKGNQITDIVQVTYFGGGIIVVTKNGLYTDKPGLFAGFKLAK